VNTEFLENGRQTGVLFARKIALGLNTKLVAVDRKQRKTGFSAADIAGENQGPVRHDFYSPRAKF
jgi:hypothetical protein